MDISTSHMPSKFFIHKHCYPSQRNTRKRKAKKRNIYAFNKQNLPLITWCVSYFVIFDFEFWESARISQFASCFVCLISDGIYNRLSIGRYNKNNDGNNINRNNITPIQINSFSRTLGKFSAYSSTSIVCV